MLFNWGYVSSPAAVSYCFVYISFSPVMKHPLHHVDLVNSVMKKVFADKWCLNNHLLPAVLEVFFHTTVSSLADGNCLDLYFLSRFKMFFFFSKHLRDFLPTLAESPRTAATWCFRWGIFFFFFFANCCFQLKNMTFEPQSISVLCFKAIQLVFLNISKALRSSLLESGAILLNIISQKRSTTSLLVLKSRDSLCCLPWCLWEVQHTLACMHSKCAAVAML